jgi:hypothetical protein
MDRVEASILKSILNEIVSVCCIVSSMVHPFIPFLADGKPSWAAHLSGAWSQAFYFTAGRLLLRFLLVGQNNISHLYGSSSSVVLVCYSFFIHHLFYTMGLVSLPLKPILQISKWTIRLGSKA